MPSHSNEKNQFFGLSGKLDQIMRYIEGNGEGPIMIQGMIGSGKSKLLREVRDSVVGMSAKNRKYHHIEVITSDISDKAQFARKIWDELLGCAQNKYHKIPREFYDIGFTNDITEPHFQSHLDRFRTHFPNNSFIVIMDDFNIIFDNREAHHTTYSGILALIKGLQNYSSLPSNQFTLLFVLSTRRKIPQLQSAGIKPWTIPLGSLHENDFNLMCIQRQSQIQLTKEAITWLFEYTHGIPYFALMILETLSNQYKDRKKDGHSFLEAVQGLSSSLASSDEFGDWLDSLKQEEQNIFMWMRANKGKINYGDLRTMTGAEKACNDLGDELRSPKYLARDENGYQIDIPCLQDWLIRPEMVQISPKADQSATAGAAELNIPEKGFVIIKNSQTVFYNGKKLPDLPKLEFRCLLCLAESPDHQTVKREDLIKYVYNLGEFIYDYGKSELGKEESYFENISQVISRLRKKLGNAGAHVKTRTGIGYGLADAEIKII